MTLAANETLDLNATTFRTEATKIVNSHPDVILTEALGPTDATFLSEVKQLNGGKMIPVIGTSATGLMVGISTAGTSSGRTRRCSQSQAVLPVNPVHAHGTV